MFEMLNQKIRANFQRIIELFTQKIVTKLSKIWVWDPRSGIRKKPITDPGSRGQKSTGSRIRIRNTGHQPSDNWNDRLKINLCGVLLSAAGQLVFLDEIRVCDQSVIG